MSEQIKSHLADAGAMAHLVSGMISNPIQRAEEAEAELARHREPIKDDCPCERCGRRDGLDAVATNSQWEEISGRSDGGGYLCLWCIDDIAHEKGMEKVHLALHFAGKACFGTTDGSDRVRDDTITRMHYRIEKLMSERNELMARIEAIEGSHRLMCP